MGRELRRVPLDFQWPLGQVWSGFVNTLYEKSSKCPHCGGTGESPQAKRLHDLWYGKIPFRPEDRGSVPFLATTDVVRARAERNVRQSPAYYGAATEYTIHVEAVRLATLWNGMWMHHVNDDDVKELIQEGRLMDFTHTYVDGEGLKPNATHVMPSAAEVNRWSVQGFGHDSLNAWVVIRAELRKRNEPSSCAHCNGEGILWECEADRLAAENWKSVEPPKGEGYQIWETVSEGSPVSPAFDTPERLARWLVNNPRGSVTDGTSYESWLAFITGPGWAPSFISSAETGLVDGVTATAAMHIADGGKRLSYDGY